MSVSSDNFDAIAQLAKQLAAAASVSYQRRTLVLTGEHGWCVQTAKSVLADIAQSEGLWVSSQPPEESPSLSNQECLKWLGRECETLVYDAHTGFDADAFGAITGTIKGGGLLLMLTPPLAQWAEHASLDSARYGEMVTPSRFIQRLVDLIALSTDVTVLSEGLPLPEVCINVIAKEAAPEVQAPCLTQDQQLAVDAIINVVRGHRRRPAVLVSDRGRGKSSALGIAAAQLLNQGLKRIVVTGPRLSAVEPVFEHATRLLNNAQLKKSEVSNDTGSLAFLPPDELLLGNHEIDCLLVDEAAAIPTPMLAKLLARYSRVVFATTVYGYEGTGRGFAIKFNQLLDQQTPGWKSVRLEAPIRWAANDPLERFVFDALLLNAAIADDDVLNGVQPEQCQYEHIDRDELVKDENLLSQVFGLLVLAHYRTRPNDLFQLLDARNLSVRIARYQQHIVGVVLIVEEGSLEPELVKDVYEGRRRLHGHLVPQSLAAHVGLVEAPCLRYARVMRIAVHPQLQSRGIGSALLQAVRDMADAEGFDCLASSFGGSVELLQFWRQAGYQPVRVGLTREQSSGAHSLMMLSGLSVAGKDIVEQASKKYFNNIVHLLSDPLCGLDPAMAVAVLQHDQAPSFAAIDVDGWNDLAAFAFAQRSVESVMAPLWHLVCAHLGDAASATITTESEKALLLAKVLQKRDWQNLVSCLKLSGRREAIACLRKATAILLEHYRK